MPGQGGRSAQAAALPMRTHLRQIYRIWLGGVGADLGTHHCECLMLVTRQLARLLSHHHAVLLEVQSSTQTCRARIRELLLQATSGRLRL